MKPVVIHVLKSATSPLALCGLSGGTLKNKARFARTLERANRWALIVASDNGPPARVCDVCAWNAEAKGRRAREREERAQHAG